MQIIPSLAGVFCFVTSLVRAPHSLLVKETCDTEGAPGNTTMCPVGALMTKQRVKEGRWRSAGVPAAQLRGVAPERELPSRLVGRGI